MSKKIRVTFISFLVVLVVGGIIFTVQQNDKGRASEKIQIYTLSGKSEDININNGLIIITPDLQKFMGGELLFEKELVDVSYLTTTFYYLKDGKERTFQGNAYSIEGGGENFTKLDAGFISSEQLFHDNDLELIKDNLYFIAEGNFTDGKLFKYKVSIDVKSVN